MKKIKQLQNNYTTPEQSKRLLELGVPADSADCYFDSRNIRRLRSEDWMLKQNLFIEYSYFTPCWSVGRLMEIIKISTKRGIVPNLTYPTYEEYSELAYKSYVDALIDVIEYRQKLGIIYFPKLEEE